MEKIISKKNTGFTLIEIMVAVTIFSIVMMIALGAVLAIVSANRKAQALSSVVNNLNFAFESMVRDLRTGNTYDCTNSSGSPVANDCATGGGHILFNSTQFAPPSPSSIPVYYALDADNRITRSINGATPSQLTASEVKIDSLKFYVSGASSGDHIQPHILVVLKGHYGESSTEKTNFNLQTFVSQRKLDI